MSEKSQLILSTYIEPPETDDSGDAEKLDNRINQAVIQSSAIEILEEISKNDFKYTWLILKDDIKNLIIKDQINFIEQIQEKIYEIYDFSFPEKISLETQYDIENFYEFLEFLEYNNLNFLVKVWSFLGIKNLMKINISDFCIKNSNKIMKEIEIQANDFSDNKLIVLFLKVLYKEKMIEWFSKNSNRLKVEITIQIN